MSYRLAVLMLVTVGSYTLSFSASAAERSMDESDQDGVWAISIDNDLFVPFSSSDRDFTGGAAFTYSGAKGFGNWRYLDEVLGRVDSVFSFSGKKMEAITPSIEFGFYGFTPDEIERARDIDYDRPYASLVYLSISRQYPMRSNGSSISTSLTFGVLGLDVVEAAQNEVHRIVGNDSEIGWRDQISDGGELTARYQVAYHDYWGDNTSSSRFKTTYFSSLGYLTEVGVAISTRRGLINSPDNRFNPELITYGERVNDTLATPNQGKERFFWGGVGFKARLYNAFLQGQFRNSPYTLDYEGLRPLIVEGWLGYTITLGEKFKLSYVLRAQSSELIGGAGDRGHVWGGFVFSGAL